ncbi:TRAP transporter small permease [Thalassospira sp.]|uniref:TRAP transporter small permease n=1 Tax=Thalassospira sp. TaxID=1912094 RepID=UPI0027356F7A|nr:TRAP transporter small permease [Thalassospira sp.]MDP2698334.1 TRAP transporter small permease [Thalassospira sp.]
MIATKLYALLITLCRIATGLAFGLLIVTVMTQVISRTFLTGSPVWTEELTRFALLFMAAFGAGLSFRNGEMVNVDMICEMLPAKFQRILLFVSASLTAVFCLMLVMPAWKFVSIGVMQTSPALGLRMDFVHVTVFILLVLLGLFAILRVVRMIAGASDGKPEGQSENLS